MQRSAFVTEVAGRVSVVRSDGRVEEVRNGDLLFEGDFLLTAGGRIRIVFADGSNLAIVDGGQLLLRQVVYDAASNTGAITVAAAGGKFQFIPGTFSDQPATAILVETPAANIHPGRSAFAFQHTSVDGLGISLIDASRSDSQPLVVDNDIGSAAIIDNRQRITVSGADSAPVLVPELASAEPDSPAAEVAAGGDEGAFPGDPIVVTGAPELFDLAPEAAPLPGPYSGAPLPVSSPFVAPEHDYLFIGSQAAWLSVDEGGSTGSGSSGGSKYRTLTGWEPLGLVWELVGSGQVTGEAPTFPYSRDSRQIQPTEKNSMAGLALVSEQVPLVTLAEFFGEGSPVRLPPSSVEVSAIRAPLALSAGDELSFDFFFDAGDTVPRTSFEPVPRNDSAVAMIRHTSLPLSSENFYLLSDIRAIADESSTREIGASGWRTVVYKVPTSGVYTIGFTAVDDRTAADPSALYVDNVRINRQFGAGWVVVGGSEDEPWRTLVQGAVARDDDQREFLTIGEDEVLLIPEASLLANDIDPDPFDPMRITGIDYSGTLGTASYASGGIVIYRTAGQFNHLAEGQTATDSFRYLVDPGNGVESTATVRVTIIGANDAPLARADIIRELVPADDTASIDVLSNDDDIDSDDDRASLRVVEAHAANGQVSSSRQPGDGVAYAPAGHYVYLGVGETAIDMITYVIQDRHGARATATVTVTVSGVNDAPTTRDDSASTNEDTATTIAVLANDTDPDQNDHLSVVAIAGSPISVDSGVTLASGAVVTLDAQGRLGYDPRGSFDRLALGETAVDSFHYEIADDYGANSQAELSITIVGRNDAPVAEADVAATGEDGPSIFIDVLANDGDIDSDDDRSSLRVVAAQSAAGAEVQFGGSAGAGLSYAPAGRFEYLAVGETAVDTITYAVEDRHGARAIGTAAVTVTGANDAPTANGDNASIDEDSVLALTLLANDTDPDRTDRLQVTSINGETIAPGGRVTLASGASVTMDVAGALAYDPRGHFDYLARDDTAIDGFRYTIADGHGGSSEADATITIVGRNDDPIAVPDMATVSEDGREDETDDGLDNPPPYDIDVLANDDDVDTDDAPRDLRVLAAEASSGAPVTFSRVFGEGITYNPAKRFDYLDEGETATDTITYRVADRRGGESTGKVTVTIVGANDAPRAADDLLMIDANSVLQLPRVGGLLQNDFDPDRLEDNNKDWMRITDIDGQSANVGATITLASGAFLTVNADGSMRYNPNGKFDGLTDFERATDSFTYTITDEHGATATATATISVQGKNDPPTANADQFVTDQDSAVRLSVLDNDADPDAGGNLRVLSIDTTGTRGSVRMNFDGTLTYTPGGSFGELRPGETATDTFAYVVDDFIGGRGTGVATITVGGVAHPQSFSQELIQSFEVGPLPNPTWEFLQPENGSSVRLQSVSQAGQVAFQPTHLATMLLLEASGWDAPAIERALSNDITFGGRPLVHLPGDPEDGSAPRTGAALKTTVSLADGDLAGGRITLSFDWNFISGEAQPALTFNDYAVFTITDGVTAQVYKLADARQTSGGSEGWRTSVYDFSAEFALPARGDLKLTLGFAVLNDQSPDNPSRLLVDNVRLNRPIDAHQELIEMNGSLLTYRERPQATDDLISATSGVEIAEDAITVLGADQLLANDRVSGGVAAATMRVVGLDTRGMTGVASLSGNAISYDPRGRFDFLAEGQVGSDTFRYFMSDGNGGADEAEVTVTVAGRNDAPSVNADTVEVEEGIASVAIDVLGNDDDIDSDDDRGTLRIVSASAVASGAAVAFAGVAGAGLVYRPSSSGVFAGLGLGESATDTITYTIEDSHGARTTGSALVTVVGRNDAPTAVANDGVTDEHTTISLAVLANDSDPDRNDRLAIAAINGAAITPGAQVLLPSGAIASVNGDGSLRYDPSSGFSRLARGQTAIDTFAYTASDGHGGSSTASVSINVIGRNDTPVAVGDVLSTSAATPLTVAASTLLANDVDPDAGDSITFVGLDTGSTLGIVTFDGASVRYDPNNQFRGLGEGETATDTFTYRISDRDGASGTGSVTVQIRGVNDAPIAGDDSALTDEDTPVAINIRANDIDPDVHDGLPAITSIDTSATRGQVTLNPDGSITYDPRGRFDDLNNGQIAHDFFTYRIADGHGASDQGTVSIEIAGRSDTERLIDSFEAPFSAANRTSSIVTTVTQYQETDGNRRLYEQTDGLSMARLEAYGTSAQKIGSQTISALEGFLGIPDRSLPRDPVDNSLPANGSACKLRVNVQAGDEISFDWMFDSRDIVSTTPADNDYAVFTVVGSAGAELFKLSDVRQTGDQGASGWRSSIYTATATGELTIGFGAVNDRVGDALGQGSVLLVDNVRFNRDFDHGYQIVDHQADGRFETVVAAA